MQLMRQSLEESRKAGDRQGQQDFLHAMVELTLLSDKLDDGVRYAEDFLRLAGDKGASDLLNSMAVAYFYKGDDSASIATFERAVAHVETAPDSAYIWRQVMRNYADILISTGQVDRGIALQERILGHYRQTGMEEEKEGAFFSLSYAWLLKGDKVRAQHYLDSMEACLVHGDYFDATQYCILGHKMVLDYATKGHYKITDMARYANDMYGKAKRKEAVAAAKEQAVQRLREHDLLMTVSRQRQFLFFIALTAVLTAVIATLVSYMRRRRRLLHEREEETEALRKLLADSLQSNAKDDRFVKKIMLQQLGVIRHAAANPTAANQQLLQRMTTFGNEQQMQRMAAIAHREVDVDALLNWDDLYRTIDSVYDGFHTNLRSRYATLLNERDLQLCCLLKANFSTKEISFVTQQSVRTVYQRKTQVRQKLRLNEKQDIAEALS